MVVIASGDWGQGRPAIGAQGAGHGGQRGGGGGRGQTQEELEGEGQECEEIGGIHDVDEEELASSAAALILTVEYVGDCALGGR